MDHELLSKYLNDTASPQEKKQVIEWLADDESDMTVYNNFLDLAWGNFTTDETLAKEDDELILKNIKEGILEISLRFRWKNRIRKIGRQVAAVAASIAFIFFTGYLMKQSSDLKQANRQASILPAWETVFNKSSGNKRIRMPDGTVVVLSAYSSISYNKEYNQSNRTVKLDGEAYFQVEGSAGQPFEVITKNVATNVLGTAFNIEAYEDEPTIRISLIQGKVVVHMKDSINDAKKQVLYPGHTLAYHVNSFQRTVKPFAIKDPSGWGKGYLIFNNIPLQDVLQRVARKYNINITYDEVAGQVSRKRVTAVFREETPEEILKSLLFVHGLKFKKLTNNVIIIVR